MAWVWQKNAPPTLVVCPSCDGRAVVRWYCDENKPWRYNDWNVGTWELRLTCSACGLNKIDPNSGQPYEPTPSLSLFLYNGGSPPFGAPLWLRADCCGETLWALNEEHLDYIAAYVAEKQRRREFPSPPGARQLAYKLPKWMKLAKNRDEILRTIDRLHAKL